MEKSVKPVGKRRQARECAIQFLYQFEMSGGDAFARYGAIRVTHVGQDFLILDWAYQTDPGNPELVVGGGVRAANPTGITVAH